MPEVAERTAEWYGRLFADVHALTREELNEALNTELMHLDSDELPYDFCSVGGMWRVIERVDPVTVEIWKQRDGLFHASFREGEMVVVTGHAYDQPTREEAIARCALNWARRR